MMIDPETIPIEEAERILFEFLHDLGMTTEAEEHAGKTIWVRYGFPPRIRWIDRYPRAGRRGVVMGKTG